MLLLFELKLYFLVRLPTVSSNITASFKVASFIVNTTDSVLVSHPDAKVFVCGDNNQMDCVAASPLKGTVQLVRI